jgi:hypothetical protein
MKTILAFIVGLLIGGALIYFFLVGAPRAQKLPGEPVLAPEAGGDPPGTVVLTLDEQFFNTLLGTIFRDMGALTFKLASVQQRESIDHPAAMQNVRFTETSDFRFLETQDGCQNQIVVTPEGSNVKTGVRLADGKIVAPLAFRGSYNTFGQCLNITGWAQGNIALRFDQAQQTLYGDISVESVNPDGVSPVFGGLVTGFVQNVINQRVNPLVLMRGEQLGLSIPVQASGGTLKAKAKDVRSEVKDNSLRLHVTYDFGSAGTVQPAQQTTPPQS